MADKTVMQSIEAPGGGVCVDLFRRADGSWGFEEYRRDPEDPRGWSAISHFSETRFATQNAAMNAATRAILWLKDGPGIPGGGD